MRRNFAYSALILISGLFLLSSSFANSEPPAKAAAHAHHPAPDTERVDAEDRSVDLDADDSNAEVVSDEEKQHEKQRQAQTSDAVDVLLEDEHIIFGKGFTFETGFNYTRFDRRQLLLDGFLALDAIFLGDITISKIESDTITLFLLGRYSFNHWLQMELYVPFVYRHTVFQKTGNEGNASGVVSKTVNQAFRIGDVQGSAYFKVREETISGPDIVLYVQVKSDTGKHPYGIHEKLIGDESDGFRVPTSVPTGNGIWAASVGGSLVKTFDPVVLFFNIAYTYNFDESFSDLNGDPEIKTPGRVDLGDIYLYGFGVALAMNERIAMNISFSQAISERTRIKVKNGVWTKVVDSEGNAATLNLGGTFALSNRFSLVANVGDGLTPDAPDVSISIKLIGYLS